VPKPEPAPPKRRAPLTRERIVRTALGIVDKSGLGALSMRGVAAKLGVEAMSLYRHVSDKDDLLLGVADLVVAEIELSPPETPWRDAMRRRAISAREVFLRHPHAALLIESCRTMTPSRLTYADAILAVLIRGGFDPTLAYRAFLMLDSYIYGFVLQELGWPHPKSRDEVVPVPEVPPSSFPHLSAVMAAVMTQVGAKGLVESYADEFLFGLDLILDTLETSLRGARSRLTQ
jgi:AcrR family transcriptional regulator